MKDLRVLYIEHDPGQRKDLTGILKDKGYRVTVAASGQTGLRQLERRSFDVVLCDLDMPDEIKITIEIPVDLEGILEREHWGN